MGIIKTLLHSQDAGTTRFGADFVRCRLREELELLLEELLDDEELLEELELELLLEELELLLELEELLEELELPLELDELPVQTAPVTVGMGAGVLRVPLSPCTPNSTLCPGLILLFQDSGVAV